MPSAAFSGELEIMRDDLARILYDATKADTRYLFGDSIAAIDDHGDGCVGIARLRDAAQCHDGVGVGVGALNREIRNRAHDVGGQPDLARSNVLSGNDVDLDRHVLQSLRAAVGGDDDLFGLRRCCLRRSRWGWSIPCCGLLRHGLRGQPQCHGDACVQQSPFFDSTSCSHVSSLSFL